MVGGWKRRLQVIPGNMDFDQKVVCFGLTSVVAM